MADTNPAWTVTNDFKLEMSNLPKPTPGPQQVLVRIHAASLNFRDLLVISNNPGCPLDTVPGLVPCSDGAGEIESVGQDSSWEGKEGERVMLYLKPWMGTDIEHFNFAEVFGGGDFDGSLQTYMVVDDERVGRAPKNLSFEEAAASITAGVTALNALLYGPSTFSIFPFCAQRGGLRGLALTFDPSACEERYDGVDAGDWWS